MWRKVKGGLSAGRVQSVSVRLIVEREREIQDFKAQASYRVDPELYTEVGQSFKAKLPKSITTKPQALQILEQNNSNKSKVTELQKQHAKKQP